MKHLKNAAALLLGATLLVGCGNGGPVSKTVTKSCFTEMQGMKATVTVSAPSEDEEIDSVKFDFDLSFDAIREASGAAGAELTDDQIKEALEASESMYKEGIASSTGVEIDAIQTEMDDDSLNMSLELKDLSKFFEIIGVSEDTKLIYKDLVESFASEEGLTCE